MIEHLHVSRRKFITRTAMAGGAIGLSGMLGLNRGWQANAAVAADYKALVCIYLPGGCDALNLVAPLDSTSHAAYRGYRQGVALAQNSLLPLVLRNNNAFQGRQVGLHSRLSYLAGLYNDGDLAVVGQVGPTPAPLRKVNGFAQTVTNQPLPPGISSHVDQYREWLQQRRDGQYIGWGGMVADEFAAANGRSVLTNISTASYSPLLGGRAVNQFTVGVDGTPQSEYLSDYNDNQGTTETIAGNAAARTNLLEREVASTFERLRGGADDLSRSLLPTSAFATPPPNIELARELATVLRIAGGTATTAMKRQIFYCVHGGFDTHSGQIARNDTDYLALNASIAWFVPEAKRLGLFDKLTLFTASEFGRSLVANGDGTDHGWAGHHLVIGGAVRGGDVYGHIPTINGDSDDFTSWGQMIPKVSVDQYGATLANWMGLSEAQIARAFPDLQNFSTRNLGFI